MPDTPRDDRVLLAVGGVLQREIAIDELLRLVVDEIRVAAGADRGTIYLLDGGTGELISKAAHLPELPEIRLRLGQGVAGYVAQTGEVVNVPASHREARFYDGVDAQTGYRTETLLAVPMRDRTGRILGVLQLLNKSGGPFDARDEALVLGLASQAGLAIETTTLYADLARAPARELAPLPIEGQFNRIVGESEELREACRRTVKAAASHATVLLRGESGTGKELFARAIHVNSPRREGPFVKVDCAALPETLVDNELFGHERGAFTGALSRAEGKFDLAQQGSVFLDEIGELPLSVQGKLLRVLQDREFLRVGGNEPVKVDARVVAATNRDLEAMVREGRFRSDLYFRIKVIEITLPPLRVRGAKDIRRLAQHFATTAAKRHGRAVPSISDAALERLGRYGWPGNVRELENCMESAVVVTEGNVIGPDDLPLPERPLFADHSASASSSASSGEEVVELAELERRHILSVLQRADGNQTEAARLLGIGRNTLARKLKKYG
jgi:Nif-specific regulatory protein